jgi:hypothetical protein
MSVVDEGIELVLLYDVGRNDFDGDSHVFVMVHGSVQVRLFDVDRHGFCIGNGQDAVEEALGCGNVGGGITNISLGEADSFGFGLLWPYFGNDA